jgi:hypothetical protein
MFYIKNLFIIKGDSYSAAIKKTTAFLNHLKKGKTNLKENLQYQPVQHTPY